MLPTPELQIARKLPAKGCAVEDAQRYTRWLATHHYENFSVVSWLLPGHLHQHFYNVYAYCRWSDDLGDEVADSARALQLLDAWEGEVRSIYTPGDGPSHPVLIALAETIRAKDIPVDPFANLLKAFRRDQAVHRYATWADVYDYCVYSANPVGRLVLYLCGYRDAERQQLSDFTCTALQLANFWQDVSVDYAKGRIYLPLDSLAKFGVSESDIAERRATPQFLEMMKFEVARARDWFRMGLPLVGKVDKHLATDLDLFSRGGLEILNAIEQQDYDVLTKRPSISKPRKLWLVARAAVGKLL